MIKKATEVLDEMVFEKEAELSDEYLVNKYGVRLKDMIDPELDMDRDDFANHIGLTNEERAQGNKVRAASVLKGMDFLPERRKIAIKQLPGASAATALGTLGLLASIKHPIARKIIGIPALGTAALGAAVLGSDIADIKRGGKNFKQIRDRHVNEVKRYGVTPQNYQAILQDDKEKYLKADKNEKQRMRAAYRASKIDAKDGHFYFTDVPEHY